MATDETFKGRFVRRMTEAGMAQHQATILLEQLRAQIEAMRGDEHEELTRKVEEATALARQAVELAISSHKINEQRLRLESTAFGIFLMLTATLLVVWAARWVAAFVQS